MNTSQAATPRIFLHVGHGLDFYSQGGNFNRTKLCLEKAMGDHAGQLLPNAQHVYVVFPEALVSEKTAFHNILTALQAATHIGDYSFSVATFSRGVVESLLPTLIEMELGDQLQVCLHYQPNSPEFSTHTLNKEHRLLNWPYGILNADSGHDFLEPQTN